MGHGIVYKLDKILTLFQKNIYIRQEYVVKTKRQEKTGKWGLEVIIAKIKTQIQSRCKYYICGPCTYGCR